MTTKRSLTVTLAIALCFFLAAIGLAVIPETAKAIIGILSSLIPGLLLLGVIFGIYFLPALVAWHRKHHDTLAVFVLNLFLGWTLIGWVVSLSWACTATTSRPQQPY